jgi:transmembrane sensor
VLGIGLVRVVGRPSEPPVTTAPGAAPVVYATAPGQRTQITLADGSTVTLSVQSVLRVPRSFGRAGAREVFLEGQGFFQVASDSSRPFTVRAGNTLTRVLGTEFDVRAYPGDRHVAVMVREGKVGVARSGTTTGVLLTRGMLATVGPDSVRVAPADPDRYLAWLSGTLRVRDRAVRDLLPELERWYGIRLRLGAPGLAMRRVTATFDAGERDTDLAHLATLLGARLVSEDSAIALVPER